MRLPPPNELGLPPKFSEWRHGQDQAVLDGLECQSRFCIQVQRPGAGKTVTYVSQALLDDSSRTIILTPIKGLQDQIINEFSGLGITDIRGRSSYKCEGMGSAGHNCDEGNISKCYFKGTSMCGHFEAKMAMSEARIGITNYSCWISSNRYSGGFGKYDRMICDEAHNLPSELARAMQIQLSEREIVDDFRRDWPDYRSLDDMEAWKHWALVTHGLIDTQLQKLKAEVKAELRPKQTQVKRLQHLVGLSRRLADIAMCKPDKWVADEWSYGYQFDPIQPAEHADKVLFKGIEKIILTSASIRPKTCVDLKIAEDDMEFHDYPRPINPARSPLIYIPTTKVNQYSQPWQLKKLVARIDEIFEGRADRKGIIHTASFKLRDFIMSNSRYSRYFVSNYVNNGDITSQVIEQFKGMEAPAVLVSPSITTGYDFPYDTCRYQIIAKLNYPYAGSKIEKARSALDPKRAAFTALQSLEQAFGRGDRALDDFQEVFVLDDSMPTLKWKYNDLASPYLWAYYREMNSVPRAIELTA